MCIQIKYFLIKTFSFKIFSLIFYWRTVTNQARIPLSDLISLTCQNSLQMKVKTTCKSSRKYFHNKNKILMQAIWEKQTWKFYVMFLLYIQCVNIIQCIKNIDMFLYQRSKSGEKDIFKVYFVRCSLTIEMSKLISLYIYIKRSLYIWTKELIDELMSIQILIKKTHYSKMNTYCAVHEN